MIIRHAIRDRELFEVSKEEEVSWIEVIDPQPEEIKYLIEKFNLPPDYLYDVNDPDEVPRVEGLEDDRANLFSVSYPIKLEDESYTTRVVSIIITDDKVITVRKEHSKVFDHIKLGDFSRVKENGKIDNFVIELAWIISKEFIDAIKEMDRKIESIQTGIKKSTKTDTIYDLIHIQKSLINFQIAIKENNPVIKSMFKLEYFYESEVREELLHDLLVENKQASIMIEKSTTMVNHLTDLFSNVISNNLNSIMKILTSITIVMTVPTIVAGLWGMNVTLPIAFHEHAFLILIVLSTIISVIIIFILKKFDYL